MSENKMPMPGDKFIDKMGQKNQVVTIAKHCETGEKFVVYQELYGDFDIMAATVEQYCRNYSDVFEKVDKSNNAGGKAQSAVVDSCKNNEMSSAKNFSENTSYREMNLKAAEIDVKIDSYKDECPEGMNLLLYAFLETETVRDRLKLIRDSDNRKYIDNKCIDDMAASIDVAIDEGDLDERIRQLISCLDTMKRFEVFRR